MKKKSKKQNTNTLFSLAFSARSVNMCLSENGAVKMEPSKFETQKIEDTYKRLEVFKEIFWSLFDETHSALQDRFSDDLSKAEILNLTVKICSVLTELAE